MSSGTQRGLSGYKCVHRQSQVPETARILIARISVWQTWTDGNIGRVNHGVLAELAWQ
jgi:hypothetical protein